MALYFIHLTEGDEFIVDLEGIERADDAAIQQAAMEGVSGLVSDAVKNGVRDYQGRLNVEDEFGANVLTLTFACPVQVDATRAGLGYAAKVV